MTLYVGNIKAKGIVVPRGVSVTYSKADPMHQRAFTILFQLPSKHHSLSRPSLQGIHPCWALSSHSITAVIWPMGLLTMSQISGSSVMELIVVIGG